MDDKADIQSGLDTDTSNNPDTNTDTDTMETDKAGEGIRRAKRHRRIRKRLALAERKRAQRLQDRRALEDPYALRCVYKVEALLALYSSLDLTVGARRIPLYLQHYKKPEGNRARDWKYTFSVNLKKTKFEEDDDIPRRRGLDLDRGTPSIASLERSDNSESGSKASTATLSGASLSSVHTGATVWSDTTLGTSHSGDSASSSNTSRGSIWSWLPRTKRSRRTWSANESGSSSDAGSNTISNPIAGGPAGGSRSQEWSRWRWPRRRRVTR